MGKAPEQRRRSVFVAGLSIAEIQREIKKKVREKEHMKVYLNHKVEVEDWHAVADAAMDIREIDSAIKTFERMMK